MDLGTKTVLVTGASGWLGVSLVESLISGLPECERAAPARPAACESAAWSPPGAGRPAPGGDLATASRSSTATSASPRTAPGSARGAGRGPVPHRRADPPEEGAPTSTR